MQAPSITSGRRDIWRQRRGWAGRVSRLNPRLNRLGRPLPDWFASAVSRIDPMLALQFSARTGNWFIFRRIARTRDSVFYNPIMEVRDRSRLGDYVRVLRWARYAERNGTNFDEMVRRKMESADHAQAQAARDRLGARIEQSLRRRGLRNADIGVTAVSMGGKRFSVQDIPRKPNGVGE